MSSDEIELNREHISERMHKELRRGELSMLVLVALRAEHYGLSLKKKIVSMGIDIEEGTLYPLIRRLESYGLLQSEWREHGNRRRRYYKVSDDGTKTLNELLIAWRKMADSLENFMEEKS